MSSVPAAIGALVASRQAEGAAIDLLDPAIYFVNPTPVSSTLTATTTPTSCPVTGKGDVILTLNATAVSGTTPSMTVAIQTSLDNATWRTIGTFTAVTGVSSQRQSFSGVDAWVQAVCTISGTTPSFTFTLSGTAK